MRLLFVSEIEISIFFYTSSKNAFNLPARCIHYFRTVARDALPQVPDGELDEQKTLELLAMGRIPK